MTSLQELIDYNSDEEQEIIGQVDIKHKNLKFRNFEPFDEELAKCMLPPLKIANIDEELLEKFKAIDDGDFQEKLNIIPKKANWDLKRDVEKKLEKINRRTQFAIYELIKQKAQEQGNDSSSSEESEGSSSESSD